MPFWSDPTIKPKQAFRWVISFGDSDYSTSTEVGNNAVLSFAAKSVTKPSYTIKTNKYKLLGSHTFNYPTAVEWQPITIKFVDIWGFKDFYAGDIQRLNSNIKIPKNDSRPEYAFTYENYVGTEQNSIANDKTLGSIRSIQAFFYAYLGDAGYVAPYEGETEDKLKRYRDSIYKQYSIEALTSGNVGTDGNSFIEIKELNDNGLNIETWQLYNPFISKVSFGDLSYENENLVEITVEIQYDWALLKPLNLYQDGTLFVNTAALNTITASVISPLDKAIQYRDVDTKVIRDGITKSYDRNRQKFYESTTARQPLNDGTGGYKEVSTRIERTPEQAIEALKPEIKREDNKAKEERVVKNIFASTRAYTELESKPRQGKLSQELSKFMKEPVLYRL